MTLSFYQDSFLLNFSILFRFLFVKKIPKDAFENRVEEQNFYILLSFGDLLNFFLQARKDLISI